MTDSFREHVCPNCGAPLGIPDEHEQYFKCEFCGTVLEDHASTEEQETGVFKIKISQKEIDAARISRLPVYSAPTAQPAKLSRRAGCILTIVILLFAGGILASVLLPTLIGSGALAVAFQQTGLKEVGEELGIDSSPDASGLGDLKIYSFGPARMLPSDDDTSPDFAGVASGPDDKSYLMYVDLENEPALRWFNEISGEEISYVYNSFLSDDTRLYYSYADRIAAYNRRQGAVIWEARLSDTIQHSICPGCFQLFEDTLMTLSNDGTLEAWDAATGESRWQTRLNEIPRQIVSFGGRPGVLDQIDGAVRFNVFNLQDGSLVEQFTPACPNEPFPNDPQELEIYNPMLAAPDGSGVYFFAGFFEPGCAQRWEPGGDRPVWQTTFSSSISSGLELENLLLSGGSLFIADRDGAYAIDLADGSFSTLVSDEDYSFLPLGERDGVLVLLAERARGTRRWEIWGVDAQLGNVKWTFTPEAAERWDYSSHPLDADGAWTAALTSEGVRVAQMYAETPRVIFQTIPLQSGTASQPVRFDFPSSGSVWVTILGWRGDEFWMLGTTTLAVVDIRSGESIAVWP